MTRRAKLTTGAAGLAAAAALFVPMLSSGGSIDVFVGSTPTPSGTPAVSCDQSISTYAAFSSAISSTSSSGKTICVTADISGAEIDPSTAMTSEAKFIAQPANGTISMINLTFQNGARNITLDGFEFTGENGIGFAGTTTGIKYIRNNCHDQTSNCITGFNDAVVNDLQVLGNRFDRIVFDGASFDGYGMYTAGATWNNLKVDYNECGGAPAPDTSADCFELGGMHTFEIVGNDIHDLIDHGAEAHADGFMTWDASTSGTIKDNRVLDGNDVLISPDGSDILIQNNLVARQGEICLDSHTNGSTDNYALRYTWANNTIWDCGAGAILTITGTTAGRGSNVFTKNVTEDVSCTASMVTSTDHNVLGGTNPCSWTGTNTYSFTPTWVAGTDSGPNSTYQVANLPLGYGDAGYQPAPLGPTACTC